MMLRRVPGCSGKIKYKTSWEAYLAAFRMEEKHPGEKFHNYRCKHCRGWHVGHK